MMEAPQGSKISIVLIVISYFIGCLYLVLKGMYAMFALFFMLSIIAIVCLGIFWVLIIYFKYSMKKEDTNHDNVKGLRKGLRAKANQKHR